MTDTLIDVLIPQMGVSVEDATVTTWHFHIGDFVRNDEPVCEISTDKVDTEVLSPVDGVLSQIIVSEGQVALVGQVIARINVQGTPVSTAPPDLNDVDFVDAPTSDALDDEDESHNVVVENRGEVIDWNRLLEGASVNPEAAAREVTRRPGRRGEPICSPLARRLAGASGIDIGTIKGSGLGGRVTRSDVMSTIEALSTQSDQVSDELSTYCPRGYSDVPHEIVTTTHQRRAISEHMIRSRRTAAHMTTEVEVDMSQVARVRAESNAARELQGLVKVSYLSLIAVAACRLLKRYPDLNATFLEDRVIRWNEVNLSVAIDTAQGLITPVIRRCEQMGVDAVATAIADLAVRARERALTPDDVRAGTFTISNPGSVGAISAMAIINQPQVAILGVPAIVKRAWVVTTADGNEAIAPRPILRLALTFDHRAVDGAEATRFLVALKNILESSDPSGYF